MFKEAEVISRYTRAQALEDGVLVDVSKLARDAGFKVPVAITAGVWADINDIPQRVSWQDPKGRLWDLLFTAAFIGKTMNKREATLCLRMPVGKAVQYKFHMIIDGGDDGNPVITIMRPNED